MSRFYAGILLTFLLCLFPLSLFSQESQAQQKDDKKEDEPIPIESLVEDRKDVLRYGIDSEVLDLIGTIRSQKDRVYDDLLAETLNTSENYKIQKAIFEYFAQEDNKAGASRAREILNQYILDYEFKNELVLAAIMYLSKINDDQAGEIFIKLLDNRNRTIAGAALRGIGNLEYAPAGEEVLSLFETYEGDSEYEDFLASGVQVLGQLAYTPGVPLLEEILDDEDSPLSQRQNAAYALGKIGEEKSFDLLKEIYQNSADSLLRAYAMKGISQYQNPEVNDLLIASLRDSFWRIRIASIEGLKERKVLKAQKILEYKVKKDPVRKVRYSAIETLASFENTEANDFLFSLFEDNKQAYDIRLTILKSITNHKNSGAIASVSSVLKEKWDKPKGKEKELAPFCLVLSKTEWTQLKPLYEKMLENQDYIVQIYGVRGIKLNKISSLKGELKALDTPKQVVPLVKEIRAALESF